MTQSIEELADELCRAAGWKVAPDWNRLAHHVLAREARVRQEALRDPDEDEIKIFLHEFGAPGVSTGAALRWGLKLFVVNRLVPHPSPLAPEVLAERLSH